MNRSAGRSRRTNGSVTLHGATVLVTGATGGLGRAIAEELAGRGAHLVLTGRRADELDALARRLGGRSVPADLADPAALDGLVADAGPVDVLVANAALPASGRLLALPPDATTRALQVNLAAPVALARALAPAMVERGRGHLVFISSLAGIVASPASSLYAATKFGLRGFALALRQDLATTGVGVSLVSPGFIRDAGMFADTGVRLPPGIGTRRPADVAAAVIRAVEEDRGEILVAPAALRAGARLGALAPVLAARLQGSARNAALADDIAATQTAKR